MSNRDNAVASYKRLAEAYRTAARRKSEQSLERLSEDWIERIRDDTPIVTGMLFNGWKWEVSGLSATWYNDVPYASEVEYSHGGGMLRINTSSHMLGAQMQKFWRAA